MTLASLLGKVWWVFDLATHFRVQYLAVGLVLIACAAVLRHYRLAFAFAACLAPHVWAIFTYPAPAHAVAIARPHDSHTLRVTSINVHAANKDYGKVIAYVDRAQPDILIILEAQGGWRDFVADFRVRFRHAAPRNWNDGSGLLLFSRYPIVDHEVVYPRGVTFPYLVATLDVSGRRVTVFAVHPPSPRDGILSHLRNFQLKQLSKAASLAKGKGHVIAAGDFNLTPWSAHYGKFVRRSGLRNAMGRDRWRPTWPTYFPVAGVPIDHVFVGPGIRVNRFRRGPDVGSDHRPVTADITLR